MDNRDTVLVSEKTCISTIPIYLVVGIFAWVTGACYHHGLTDCQKIPMTLMVIKRLPQHCLETLVILLQRQEDGPIFLLA